MNPIYINTSILPVVDYACYNDLTADEKRLTNANCYTMIYVINGSLLISNDNIQTVADEGTLVFLQKNIIHTIAGNGSKKASYVCINFFMSDFDVVTNHKITLGKTYSQSHQHHLEVRNIYLLPAITKKLSGSILDKKIHDYVEYFNSSGRLTDLDINTRFYGIISECIKQNSELHSPGRNLSDEIISYLKEHYTEQLNTADMEKKFYLTYKYMGTAFKKETGSTILGYHTKLRMNYAKRLILTTSHSIDEISRMLGYTDALYFSRVFKKNFGMSPQTFRNHKRYRCN